MKKANENLVNIYLHLYIIFTLYFVLKNSYLFTFNFLFVYFLLFLVLQLMKLMNEIVLYCNFD